jgi:murein DD-endopeptidase MepM/ murein hydrolase activator NlpD
MPSSNAVKVDGEYRFSRSLKTEEFNEQKRIKPYSSTTGSRSPGSHSSDRVQPEMDGSLDNSTSSDYGHSGYVNREPRPPRILQQTTQANYTSLSTNRNEYSGSRVAVGAQMADTAFSAEPVVPNKLSQQIQNFLSDQVTPIRLASHLAVLAVAAVVLIVSRVELPDWQFSLRNLPEQGLFTTQEFQGVALNGDNPLAAAGNSVADATEAFQRAVVPFTENQQAAADAQSALSATAPQVSAAPSQRVAIETYSVKPGDTVLGIAGKFNINPETIQWANPELEANPDLLRIGDRLIILPVDGALHVVQSGDTLYSIAARYKVAAQALVEHPLNQLQSVDTPIAIGTQLIVPGGTKPYITRQVATYTGPKPDTAVTGSGALSWPTTGSVSQTFWGGHRAIDIGARSGTPVTASDGGYVIASKTGGWNNGYGNMVMVDHGNGYVTLYAHLNSIYVRQGENVSKGQQIGTVGNTGNSTGPHLHFEVRYQGVARNPFTYLP